MSDWQDVDFFTDETLVEDPYPYFEQLRAEGPVVREPHHGVIAVSGFEEAAAVYRDTKTFSSCNAVIGPFAAFTEQPEGDDLTEFIATHRQQLPLWEHMVTMDPPDHTQQRALIMRLFTRRRLAENEAFMWRLADRLIDEFAAAGRCEFIGEYAQPFAMLVIADLLGVPEEDHRRFREMLHGAPGAIDAEDAPASDELNALSPLEASFIRYIEDRRREPRGDVLSELALATHPDGSVPEVIDIVRAATLLFAAGQETTARLLATALKHLAEHPELQDRIRSDPELVPNVVEETLRIESPVKSDFRMTTRATRVGELEVSAGATVMLLNGAANRDPRRFDRPAEFVADRPNAVTHIAFGRGVHTCPGAPLARVEAKVSLQRLLDRLGEIRVSDEHHGQAGARRFRYTPTFILRGMDELHLEFRAR